MVAGTSGSVVFGGHKEVGKSKEALIVAGKLKTLLGLAKLFRFECRPALDHPLGVLGFRGDRE